MAVRQAGQMPCIFGQCHSASNQPINIALGSKESRDELQGEKGLGGSRSPIAQYASVSRIAVPRFVQNSGSALPDFRSMAIVNEGRSLHDKRRSNPCANFEAPADVKHRQQEAQLDRCHVEGR